MFKRITSLKLMFRSKLIMMVIIMIILIFAATKLLINSKYKQGIAG